MSEVAAVNATANKQYGVIRNQAVLGNKTTTTIGDENQLFNSDGKQDISA